MKKLLKMTLPLAAAATVAAPIAATVSCGSSKSNASTVVIKTTWAATGPQLGALKALVAEYNKQKAATDFPVEVQKIQGGYGDIVPLELKDIKNKNMNPVADIVVDYPDQLGKLAPAGAALDFSEAGGVQRSDFEDKFIASQNDQIEGAASGKIFAVPFAASSEALSANLPVLHQVLVDAKANGATIAAGAAGSLLEKANNFTDTTDAATVATNWKLSNGAAFNGISIDDSTFTDYYKLFDFAKAIESAYGKDAKGTEFVLGADAPTNLVYQLAYLQGDADMANFLFAKDANDKVQFNFQDANSKAGQSLKAVLEKLQPYVASGALRMFGGGAYSSNDFKNHRSIFSLGSTSGIQNNFEGVVAEVFTKGAITLNEAATAEIVAPTATDTAKYGAGLVAVLNDSVRTPLFENGTDVSTRPAYKAYWSVLNANVDATIKAALGTKTLFATQFQTAMGTDAAFTKAFTKANKEFAIVDKSVLTSSLRGNSADKVQDKEMFSTVTPSSINGAANHVFMNQGPSLIGIKHGGQKDASTRAFVKWLFDKNSKVTISGFEQTPIQYFDENANYISPVAGAFTNVANPWKDGNAIAYQAFHQASTDAHTTAFVSPVNQKTAALRKTVFDVTMKDVWYNSAHTSGANGTKSANDIYSALVGASKGL